MIVLKEGVRLHGIRPEVVVAILIAERLMEERGETLVITSVIDGAHMRASIHYTGGAFDFRAPRIDPGVMRDRLAQACGGDFDVVIEGDHIHLEWQPKVEYGVHGDS